jgi:hypothetical protein
MASLQPVRGIVTPPVPSVYNDFILDLLQAARYETGVAGDGAAWSPFGSGKRGSETVWRV